MAKELKVQHSIKGFEDIIAKKLIKSFDIEQNPNLLYPFTKLSHFQKVKTPEKRILFKIETRIINDLLKRLYDKIEYSDDLMKYPFSLTYIEGKWEEWERIYFPYIESVESNLIKIGEKNINIFRNYDFALQSDIYHRIIDLVIISIKEHNSELNTKQTQEIVSYDYEITFIYCNRTLKPLKYMKLLKFVNEIKNFSKVFKQDKKNRCKSIRSQLILISLCGYEIKIKDYLRNHLFRETDYVIPILVIPPINNEIWHNISEYNDLMNSLPQKKKELEKILKISKNEYSSSSFRIIRGKSVKSEYKQIIEGQKIAKLDKDFLSKWYDILNVQKASKILNSYKVDADMDKNIEIIKENLKIY
ncbi:MAG: hypothetical protein ACFFC9_03910 [Promethearchaeota archaeon]